MVQLFVTTVYLASHADVLRLVASIINFNISEINTLVM